VRHVAFARRFGELEKNRGKSRFTTQELTDQSNIDVDGSLIDPDSAKGRISKVRHIQVEELIF
jgi:hypothetical protein